LREAGAKRAQVTDPLRVLLVEDSENDAMLLLRELTNYLKTPTIVYQG
jgi:hypothetical protein